MSINLIMKNLGFLVLLILSFSVNTVFAQETDEKETEQRLQNKYMQFLKEEGFMPSVDDDGDVKFKSEGDSYYLSPYGKDPLFFSLVRYLKNTDEVHSLKIFEAVNKANFAYKTVGVYLTSNDKSIIINAASYLANEDDFKRIFYRSLKNARKATQLFLDEYNK